MLKKEINDDTNLEEISISQLSDEDLNKIIDYIYNTKIKEYIAEKKECFFGDVFSKIIAVVFELSMMKEFPKMIFSDDKSSWISISIYFIGMLASIELNNYYVNFLKELKEEMDNLEKDDIKTLTKKIDSIHINRKSKDLYINLK